MILPVYTAAFICTAEVMFGVVVSDQHQNGQDVSITACSLERQ